MIAFADDMKPYRQNHLCPNTDIIRCICVALRFCLISTTHSVKRSKNVGYRLQLFYIHDLILKKFHVVLNDIVFSPSHVWFPPKPIVHCLNINTTAQAWSNTYTFDFVS